MSTKLFPSVQVGAAKTANRFVKLRGSTHVSALCRLLLSFTCMQAFEDKECVCVQCKCLLGAPCTTDVSCLVSKIFETLFSSSVSA